MIGIKYNKPIQVFDVLMDSDPDPDMIICKDKQEAERSLYQEYMRAIYEIQNQYNEAVEKIRRAE